ncbi:MAG: noncanonical pyrimidine nucleotidase, YjjG family [Bacteroidetes bacterium GWF2_38_335]|nr:MAG: noncanonical pyrimidine nucleotidase, YjjG family [Bacteroidetes bacterium GWF2_38_335]OFY81509.1 MAG: noncanonical pyrimidine nucleotidase, YjjG family [Bacteroidetes bacterium RIFOXYA12_FULL_38_20]HBS87678.1 noncanonical pyrimidine nucleotidase, YjjG family [Bacteroidales bacterium]
MKKYKHLFFDLDRTLWDFEKNALELFMDIFKNRQLDKIFPDFDIFYTTYKKHNDALWELYRHGKIKKDILRYKRFSDTLEEFGFSDANLAKNIGDDYVNLSPYKNNLFPNTIETLEYLYPKYKLYIITNGFKEVQFTKLKKSNLERFFTRVITSEDVGVQKPNPEIFHYSVSSVNAKKIECLMIGDDPEVDILGARKYGIDQVLFNTENKKHSEKPTYEISDLSELKNFL